ncbi:MAG: AAA family ATPase [Proteobacteria bacterium]|nr:AAA family ATPase [Pseudomonadota bacterium]
MNKEAQPWVLALSASADELHCLLSNGFDRFVHARGECPGAADEPTLPGQLTALLREAQVGWLRLQLQPALDLHSWEVALQRFCSTLAVSRHLGGAADPADVALAGVEPLDDDDAVWWLHAAPQQGSAAALGAQAAGRPLLLVSAQLPVVQAQALRRALGRQWRGGLWLSQAAARVAAQLALPRAAWRLYGDARAAEVASGGPPQRRLVTALKLDMVDSTGLTERWGAERYALRYAGLHGLCREQVEAHGGHLDDPRGNDGWMAYFGLSSGHEDAAAQAVLAGEAVLRLAPTLGFEMRGGVATGRLALRDGLAFGNEVNLAARLQAHAQPGALLVSAGTAALLGPGIEREEIGVLTVRGMVEPQRAFRVLAVSEVHAAARARPLQGCLVGRQREFAELVDTWRDVQRRRRGAWRCIIGEPGIGKSRLLREFDRSLQATLAAPVRLLLAGRAELQTSAFAALALGLQASVFEALAERLRDSRAPGANAPETDAALLRQRLLDDLLAAVTARARLEPVCVIVDDAHWLDPSTLEFIERLRRDSAELPLLLVVALRDDAASLACGLSVDDALALRALDQADSLELLASLSAGEPLSERLQQSIAARAGGNPLYLEETARMVRARPDAAELAERAIPLTLDELLVARLEGLGAALPLARLAAVLGGEFPAALWNEVLAEPDEWVAGARRGANWQRLLASGLVVAEGVPPLQTLRFKHALIRDAAYQSLWANDRRRLHAIVARVIERIVERDDDTLGAALQLRAHHLAEAGELEAASQAWMQAARQAAAAAADREALALARRALALLAQLPDTPALRQQALQLHLLEAARCIALDGYGAASVEAAYLRAAALCSDAPDATMRTRVELGLEACYAMRGDLARARALAEAAVRATGWQPNLRLALQARWAWINVVFHQGHLGEALEMADQCLARYEPALHQPRAVQDPAIMCLCYSAWGLFERGCAGLALLRVQRLLELARRLDHAFSHAVAHGFAASVLLFRGEHELGLEQAEEAVRRCAAADFRAWLAHARVVRGRLWAGLGDARAGLAEMEQGLALWTATGARITAATYLAFQAEACLMLGQPDEALRRLLQAHEIALRHGEHYHEAELLRLQGWARWLLRRDEADANTAQTLLQRGLALARTQGRLGFVLRGALTLGRVDVECGEAARAIVRLKDALDAVPDHHGSSDARQAQECLGDWQARVAR